MLTEASIGILGGGQLARMLALKAYDFNLSIKILSPSADDPAAQITSHWVKGDPNNKKDLRAFFKELSIVTFESEFANIPLIREACKGLSVQFYPNLDVMETLQDRWHQKQSLDVFQLKTSPFIKIDTEEQARVCQDFFNKAPFVLKKRKYGYDGYGTFVIKSSQDLEDCLKQQEQKSDLNFIAEAFIPFKKELSIMAFRNISGQVQFYPLVESFQKKSKCLWVKGPQSHWQEKELKIKIRKFLNEVDYVGAIAFELFDFEGELWINEVAPRVHNTAHYSMDTFLEDQFLLHLKCLINSPLKRITNIPTGFAMYNLIGSHNKKPQLSLPSGGRLHWYGKKENRPGRKMGHINTIDKTPQKALQRIKNLAKEFKL